MLILKGKIIMIIMIMIVGKWWHAGFHLTTAIVGPTILTLPYAFRGLGWVLGFLCLTIMGTVTFYSYYLMSKVLDHCEKAGRRHIRFRELASDVLGNITPPKKKSTRKKRKKKRKILKHQCFCSPVRKWLLKRRRRTISFFTSPICSRMFLTHVV